MLYTQSNPINHSKMESFLFHFNSHYRQPESSEVKEQAMNHQVHHPIREYHQVASLPVRREPGPLQVNLILLNPAALPDSGACVPAGTNSVPPQQRLERLDNMLDTLTGLALLSISISILTLIVTWSAWISMRFI
ncbi:hypothetical protein CKO35_09710 [Ectothiorhodospira shaposhnikovii]|uniref:hypothetical protein n=1 Tax=Ectothiorhodospira shaposhnikovii TaxID=1054 RepID=UPI0019075393|nr:hypothetical protein [Ectothiorhodospira shaposhnikovii]MBK1673577.1 hypothetical protein [Ectothiorhodospira shaposhnikovii]